MLSDVEECGLRHARIARQVMELGAQARVIRYEGLVVVEVQPWRLIPLLPGCISACELLIKYLLFLQE